MGMAKSSTLKKRDTTEDWKLYEQGVDYNNSLEPSYYPTINRNWRAYNLQLYDAVDFKGMTKVTLPMAQRIIKHSVASCATKSVKMNYVAENIDPASDTPDDIEQIKMAAYLTQSSRDSWERLQMDAMIETLLLNGANEGDYATHTYWDASYDTGQTYGEELVVDKNGNPVFDEYGNPQYKPVPILGEFFTEVVDGCNVFLSNPNDRRINFNGKPFQDYVIIAGRQTVNKLRKEAKQFQKENGLTDDEIESLITADVEYDEQAGDRGRKEILNGDSKYGKATYTVKYWVDESGKVMFNKSVRGCYIRKDVDSELTLYPVAFGNWDTIKNSYHGQGLMTGLINNQIALDTAWMKFFKYFGDMAFPKAVANASYFPDRKLSNKIGEVIWYEGNENVYPANVLSYTQPGQLANGVIDAMMAFKNTTMDLLGASDAVLGTANPENTSALIQQNQAAAVPLEKTRRGMHQFIEDNGYIWLDFRLHKYKVPRKIFIEVDGQRQMVEFDPSKLKNSKFRITVDVVAGGYLDEATAIANISNLFARNAITAVDLIKRLPNGSIPDREQLVKDIEKRVAEQEYMQSQEFKMQAVDEFLQEAQQAGGENAGNPM